MDSHAPNIFLVQIFYFCYLYPKNYNFFTKKTPSDLSSFCIWIQSLYKLLTVSQNYSQVTKTVRLFCCVHHSILFWPSLVSKIHIPNEFKNGKLSSLLKILLYNFKFTKKKRIYYQNRRQKFTLPRRTARITIKNLKNKFSRKIEFHTKIYTVLLPLILKFSLVSRMTYPVKISPA